MKIALKVGDTVTVTKGKLAGKEAKVLFIDKKALRVRLDGLKKAKSGNKEVHGTFHLTSVKAKAAPAAEAAAEASA